MAQKNLWHTYLVRTPGFSQYFLLSHPLLHNLTHSLILCENQIHRISLLLRTAGSPARALSLAPRPTLLKSNPSSARICGIPSYTFGSIHIFSGVYFLGRDVNTHWMVLSKLGPGAQMSGPDIVGGSIVHFFEADNSAPDRLALW